MLVGGVLTIAASPAGAATATVSTEAQLRTALADPSATAIVASANSVDLVDCTPSGGDLDRQRHRAHARRRRVHRAADVRRRARRRTGRRRRADISDITVTGGRSARGRGHEASVATAAASPPPATSPSRGVAARGQPRRQRSWDRHSVARSFGVNVDVEDSIVSNNEVHGGRFGVGGGIGGRTVTVTGSTVEGNLAAAVTGDTGIRDATAFGGGIVRSARSPCRIRASTRTRSGPTRFGSRLQQRRRHRDHQDVSAVAITSSHVDGNSLAASGERAGTAGGGIDGGECA